VALNYRVIEIFTSEDARCGGTALYRAVVHKVSSFRIAARCVVTRGIAGSYESGEVATQAIEVLSYNMPLKIEIILPAAELSRVLPEIEAMVTDGMVVVEEMDIRCHRTKKRLIPRQVRVRDTMTGSPQSVSPETPATEVVHILRSARFHGLPVVDAAGKPVGIITQGDLIRRGGLPLRVGLLAELDSEHFGAAVSPLAQKTAADIMSAPVVTVAADATLTAAVDLMLARQLKRLPVVDGEGRLCGMLARLDVFQVISRDTPSWQRMREQHVAVGDVRYVRDIMGRDTHEVARTRPSRRWCASSMTARSSGSPWWTRTGSSWGSSPTARSWPRSRSTAPVSGGSCLGATRGPNWAHGTGRWWSSRGPSERPTRCRQTSSPFARTPRSTRPSS